MSAAIEELRQNDPETKCILVHLRRETDADLAQALEQNPFVTEIDLDLEGVQQTDWDSLERVIATRGNLETLTLEDSLMAGDRNAPATLVRSILRATQQNNSVRSVDLRWLRLPTDISTFFDNVSSITNFQLRDCDMEPSEREQGARSLAVALQRNKNIETLSLRILGDIYAIPILEALRLNTSVKTFIFSPCESFSDAAAHALQHLLESTTSIQRFELLNEASLREMLLRPIAQAITGSECISELRFLWCRFRDRNSFAQLQSILQNKRNLTSLCLHGCRFDGGQVHEDIISILSRPDSLLRCFEFQSGSSLEIEFPIFEALIQAIQKSTPLERFKIGSIQSQHQMQTLLQSIPSMRIRELEVSFAGQFWREDVNSRQNLLLAIKNNFSLRSVKGDLNFDDLFGTAEDKKTLTFYANRNESLDRWVDKPEMVEQQKLWPEALQLAERAGPNALFRGLRSVLGRDYASLPGGRKRKHHPQYQVPS